MLLKPFLARCDDRHVKAKINLLSGEPTEWFNDHLLSVYGLTGFTFDFFVDWRTNCVSPIVWIKRLVDDRTNWPELDQRTLTKWLRECDGEDHLLSLVGFCRKTRLRLEFMIFPESRQWAKSPPEIVSVTPDSVGHIDRVELLSLDSLKRRIREYSGGPVSIGSKGLIYATSTLECHLSHTDALWPGDVDLVLVDHNMNAMAIIEFKKHTLSSPIESQRLTNYYPRPDGRKYNRLALLRDFFGTSVPIIVLYYPTNPDISKVKLELVTGEFNKLRSKWSHLSPLPRYNDDETRKQLIDAVLELVYQADRGF